MITTREPVVFDCELIGPEEGPVSFLFRAVHLPTGRKLSLWGNDAEKIGMLLNNPNYLWVSFNGEKFDLPVLAAVVSGRPLTEVKRMANRMITEGMPPWMVYRDYALERFDNLDHIDLFEVAPGVQISLKLYMARMGMPTIQDLPFEHDTALDFDQMGVVDDYCGNDIEGTAALFKKLDEALTLREHMSETYGIDVRSKSDAQMAETIIAKELGLLRSSNPPVPKTVRYRAPEFVQPRGMILKDILARVERTEFKVHHGNGSVILPDFLANEQVLIGSGSYQMGVGGLHSTHDKSVFYRADDGYEIVDADVGSFYPNILINAGLIPRGLGQPFINLYRTMLIERMAAKKKAGEIKKRIREIEKELENAA